MKIRETQVLELLINGCTNPEIARRLGVTDRAVKYHLKRIYERHQVGSARELLAAISRTVAGRTMNGRNGGLGLPTDIEAAVLTVISNAGEPEGRS